MYCLPTLELELTLGIDGFGHIFLAKPNKEAFTGLFAVTVRASSTDDFEVAEVTMGSQPLEGEMRRKMALMLEDARDLEIRAHIVEHLGDAKDGARAA